MIQSGENFNNAISGYLKKHGSSQMDMYSLATRHTYATVVGDPNVARSELNQGELDTVSMVEELAGSYIALQDIHPAEAVTLAHKNILDRSVGALNILFKFTYLTYSHNMLWRRQAIQDLVGKVPDNDNWLYYGTEEAWLNYKYPS